MQFLKNGITVTIEDSEIRRLVLAQLNCERNGVPEPFGSILIPRIGSEWDGQGGIYAGIMRGREGEPDYHLIVGPEFDDKSNWQTVMDWAKRLSATSQTGFSLPFLKEQSLCFANVPELFEPDWYWSCEQHASDSYDAWFQDFNYGHQGYWGKDYGGRARAVRRLPIR